MKALGLDVGDRRIGLAAGDTAIGIGIPAGFIERSDEAADIASVLREARSRDARVLVVGVPYTMSGKRGPQAASVERFIAALRDATDLEVETTDERLSTVEAQRRMAEARGPAGRGKSRRLPKGADDAAAAAVLLTAWLEARHGHGSG